MPRFLSLLLAMSIVCACFTALGGCKKDDDEDEDVSKEKVVEVSAVPAPAMDSIKIVTGATSCDVVWRRRAYR